MAAKFPSFPRKIRVPRWFFTINHVWILTLFMILLGAISLDRSASALSPISDDILYRCTNAIRQEYRQAPLSRNDQLNRAAQLKLEDMSTGHYWAHQNPFTGKQPWDFVDEAGYDYRSAGENLAIGYELSEGICDAWEKSPSHFANLINPDFREVGFAYSPVVLDEKKSGVLVVQIFGARSESEKSASTVKRCASRVKSDVQILYPPCGVLKNDDPLMIVYNPRGQDLVIELDGKKTPTTLTEYGDFYRYEFSQPFAIGKHRLRIQVAKDPLQVSRLLFTVQAKQDGEISEVIGDSISANILSNQNPSGYTPALLVIAIAALALFLRRTRDPEDSP